MKLARDDIDEELIVLGPAQLDAALSVVEGFFEIGHPLLERAGGCCTLIAQHCHYPDRPESRVLLGELESDLEGIL